MKAKIRVAEICERSISFPSQTSFPVKDKFNMV